MMEKQ
jgi:2,3-bisphosphoglycerate-dependent phosphoglycerate mutase